MRSLIEQYIVAASSVKTGSVVADAGSEAPAARPASPRAAEGRSAEGHAKVNRVAASLPAAVPPSPSRMFRLHAGAGRRDASGCSGGFAHHGVVGGSGSACNQPHQADRGKDC